MNKFIWVAMAAVVAIGGYTFITSQPEEAPKTAVEELSDTVKEAADMVEEAAGDAMEEVGTAVEEAAAGAEEAVEAAVESAQETVNETMNEVVDSASESAEEMATDAQEAVDSAAEEASSMVDAAAEYLTVDGFDIAKVTEMLEAAGLDQIQMTQLTTALEAAKSNPELLQGVLDQVKTALGL